MANILSARVLCRCAYILLIVLITDAKSNVAIPFLVFQPSYLVTSGPRLAAFLLGNTSGISLTLSSLSRSNPPGRLPPPSCSEDLTQWVLTQELVGKTTVRVQLSLNRSLLLCGNNNDTDCCPEPLCVLETLRVSACLGNTSQASLLIQARIYAQVFPTEPVSDNKTVIPNQVYRPLGSCSCDLTVGACDVRCCCDKDCSPEALKLFQGQCLSGPFGGEVSPVPDYLCIAQSAENAPDWFPFLCVISLPENNPFLGLFYEGDTITPKPRPSFQKPVLSAPLPTHIYQQGDPIFTISDQYFTIPQNSLVGQCVDNAPVAFLKNFQAQCVTRLLSCPTGPPLQTTPTELRVQVRDGQGGVVTVDVTDKMAVDLRPFVASPVAEDGRLLCENVTLALNYKFFWKGNGLTNITLTRILGNVLSASVGLTASYSVVFLNGDALAQPNSGNPGYQVGRPVIGGIVDTLGNGTVIQRTPVNLWKPVSSGLCASEGRIVLFGENSTAGCLLPVSLQNLTQCSLLSQNVASLQRALSTATHIARNGDPDVLNLTDWLNISFVELNSNQPVGGGIGICSGIPSHRHIHVRSIVTEVVGGLPQREIQAVEVSDHVSTWKFECGGGDPCLEPTGIQTFPVTSSITFTDISINTGPPKTRFQINFTEYDCDRNDVCWPQLAFPLTRYYTGESYSLSLAKGLILVFFFITASILGTPWKQIRQAWRSASL
ncbi:tectonic-2 isoform X1 [Oncorhynchus mykiss]|uniref:tectonic-2 isoform X1 n=1 Tax=Oncorhynchus mykiss TaxID=8022 RepID=UPI0018786049|nr:tectonic-2 isoform X1 [Oncorhynchus mykiss]